MTDVNVNLIAHLITEGYQGVRSLPDGRLIATMPMAFTAALFVDVHEHGYEKRYCYETLTACIDAFLKWDGVGDPPGPWIKVKGEPDGDRINPEWRG